MVARFQKHNLQRFIPFARCTIQLFDSLSYGAQKLAESAIRSRVKLKTRNAQAQAQKELKYVASTEGTPLVSPGRCSVSRRRMCRNKEIGEIASCPCGQPSLNADKKTISVQVLTLSVGPRFSFLHEHCTARHDWHRDSMYNFLSTLSPRFKYFLPHLSISRLFDGAALRKRATNVRTRQKCAQSKGAA